MNSRIVVAVSLFLCALQASAKTGGQNRPVGRFHPLVTFTVPGEVAEIRNLQGPSAPNGATS